MHLTMTGHHVDVTDSMRNYVTGKLKRLKKHAAAPLAIQVTLTVEKERRKAEGTLDFDGTRLHASTVEPDMYAAIDLLADKLDRQLIRHKEKSRAQGNERIAERIGEPERAEEALEAE